MVRPVGFLTEPGRKVEGRRGASAQPLHQGQAQLPQGLGEDSRWGQVENLRHPALREEEGGWQVEA